MWYYKVNPRVQCHMQRGWDIARWDKGSIWIYLLGFSGKDQQGTDLFCPRCPVYDMNRSISSNTLTIPFTLGCTDNICRSRLKVTSKIIGLEEEDKTFTLGAKSYLTFQIDIKKTEEKAYLTQVLTTVPDSITFRSIPSTCTEKNSSSVMCFVDNPLETNSQ
ncbi:hypothetical protein Zmor_023671 [Zophobas morio]|uniref:Integrin alpha second immunoglobulin-like domain-containing protein n=1 Tax=Zophobas morio TaxID=2755281 RepID=A0AA38HXL4_9CUCU|nr:hypothetical protein Zmor_023671 [Zophobas morio]